MVLTWTIAMVSAQDYQDIKSILHGKIGCCFAIDAADAAVAFQ